MPFFFHFYFVIFAFATEWKLLFALLTSCSEAEEGIYSVVE